MKNDTFKAYITILECYKYHKMNLQNGNDKTCPKIVHWISIKSVLEILKLTEVRFGILWIPDSDPTPINF